jgi:hypothetical protein
MCHLARVNNPRPCQQPSPVPTTLARARRVAEHQADERGLYCQQLGPHWARQGGGTTAAGRHALGRRPHTAHARRADHRRISSRAPLSGGGGNGGTCVAGQC